MRERIMLWWKKRRRRKQKEKADDIRWGRSMIVTSAMILLILTASFSAINHINRMEEDRSFERLYQEAERLADMIQRHAAEDEEELEMIAALIAKTEKLDSKELWELLDSYKAVGMMSRIELLLPDDTVLREGGERIDAEGILSFEETSAKGTHITDREKDLTDADAYVVRHYVPVVREGETIAMLYGVIELGTLPEDVDMNPYEGKAAVYMIDGRTGDMLVDTWHSEAGGNIWALGKREMAPGYDHQQLKQGLIQGDSRYVVFVSRTAGEYLYFYYRPIQINEWRVAVSVPESVVFENADAIEQVLNIFLLIEMACFVLYLLWMAHYVRRVTGEKQRRLETLNDIYDVGNLLFDAHEREEHIGQALEKIGSILPAEQAAFWILGEQGNSICFFWRNGKRTEKYIENGKEGGIRRLLEYFREGNGEFEAWEGETIREWIPISGWTEVGSIAAVPVEDMEGKICGILAGGNLGQREGQTSLLKNMKFSFGMLCHNLQSYERIREQRDRDALTGLYNRTRYERELPVIFSKYKNALACIYIDVDGLHEMNNREGHGKGDLMLKDVAEGIKKAYPTEYFYRIGGDEFVGFVSGMDEEKLQSISEGLMAELETKDYHISVGIQWETEVSDMETLIKSAEEKMYAEKRNYYEQEANDRRRGVR